MAKKLTFTDLAAAARQLGTDIPEIRTVADVESEGGGFLPDGRVVIRFEGHIFRKLTGGKFDASYQTISHPYMVNCPYNRGSVRDYIRLKMAMGLDAQAAMKACSWGMFQIMGFNHKAAGYKTVDEFVDAMKVSEGSQLRAFCQLLISFGLDDELREHRWAEFALRYNGAGYKGDPDTLADDYDLKLARAYARFVGAPQSITLVRE